MKLPNLDRQAIDRIVEMAWEDRTTCQLPDSDRLGGRERAC